MYIKNNQINHTPLDFVCDLEDAILERINEVEIDLSNLKSYYVYKGYKDRIEFSYDPDEAYPFQLAAFRNLLKRRGWFYALCYKTKSENRWQKATKNKKLYNRIQKFIIRLLYTSF